MNPTLKSVLSYGAAIAGATLAFLRPPNLYELAANPDYYPDRALITFLVTAAAGICTVIIRTGRDKKTQRPSTRLLIILLICTIGSYAGYLALLNIWTVPYSEWLTVVGREFLPDAQAYYQNMRDSLHGTYTLSDLVMDYGGRTQLIWLESDLQCRRIVLIAVHIIAVLIASVFLVLLVAAIPEVSGPDNPYEGRDNSQDEGNTNNSKEDTT